MGQYKWYAVYTKSRAEKKVVEALDKKGIRSYLPIRTIERKWKDRRKKIDVPIIASYVFVYMDIDTQKVELYNITGFVSYVSENRQPKPIPESEIDMMRKAVDSTWTLEVNNNTFVKGQRVKLRREPLKGLEGIVTDVSSKKVHLVLPAIGVTLVVDLEHADFDYL